jgi:hypothetical protein
MEAFASPAAASAGPKPADLQGQLVIFKPIEYRSGIDTVNGPADAISCDIINLDTNEEHSDVLFFNIAIRNALRPLIGQRVLGRIQQGVAKPGKTAPWIIADASTDAAAVAKAAAYKPGSAASAPKAAPAVDGVPPEVAALLAQLGAKPV